VGDFIVMQPTAVTTEDHEEPQYTKCFVVSCKTSDIFLCPFSRILLLTLYIRGEAVSTIWVPQERVAVAPQLEQYNSKYLAHRVENCTQRREILK
jgi:hypothetical protein